MYSETQNFLYIHVPKTGGNSVQNVIREYSVDEIVCHTALQDGLERFETQHPCKPLTKHATLRQYVDHLGRETVERAFVFFCTRNPWDRLVSYYFSPHRGEVVWDAGEFSAFIRTVEPLEHFVCEAARTSISNLVDKALRFQHLREDFAEVSKSLGLPDHELPWRNRSSHLHYSRYYTLETRDWVRTAHAFEIERFDYEFEPN